jgi:hypothetical protein
MTVTPQFPAVLGSRFFPSHTVRCDHFNTAIIKKLIVKFIAVVHLITNQLIRRIPSKAAVYSSLDKLYFMGRSAFNMSGDRKTSSVCDCHDLGGFAALCLADSETLFFCRCEATVNERLANINFTAFIQVLMSIFILR